MLSMSFYISHCLVNLGSKAGLDFNIEIVFTNIWMIKIIKMIYVTLNFWKKLKRVFLYLMWCGILLPSWPSAQVPDQGPRVPGLGPSVPGHHHQVAGVLPHRPAPAAAAGHAARVARQRSGVSPAPTSPLIHVWREVRSPRLLAARQHRHPIQVLTRLRPGFAHCQCQGQIMGGGLGLRRHWAGRSTPDCHKWKEGWV